MVMQAHSGLGITGRVGNKARWHVFNDNWGNMPATDYWFDPENADIITASSPHLLTAAGGVTTGTLDVTASSQASNFMATTVPTTLNGLRFNSSGERIMSPVKFGSVQHTRWIRDQLGWAPSKLIAEFYFQFTTSSNNEDASGAGFVKGSIVTDTNGLAVIASDGTNFRGKAAAASFTGAATGPLIDNLVHRAKIVMDSGPQTTSFLMDGTAFSATVAIPTASFPCAFAAGVATSNVLILGLTHVYYDA